MEADEAAARDVIARTGQRGVPVIAIGADLIVGFQRRQLDALLALGAPDTAVEATLPPAQDTTAEAVAARRLTLTPDQQAQAWEMPGLRRGGTRFGPSAMRRRR